MRLGNDVPIDVCVECDGVWLDPGEIREVCPEFDFDNVPRKSYVVPHAAMSCPACQKGNLIPTTTGSASGESRSMSATGVPESGSILAL